jgi:hypothetical protein
MRVDKLIELREKIGNEPIIPDAEDKYEVMQMMKQPQTMEEMQAAARLRTQEDPEYSAKYKAPKQKPLRGGGGLAEQAENVRQAGRYGDTELMHVTPEEAKELSSLRGGVTLNPETNLPEAFAPAFLAAAPAIGAAVAPAVAAPLAMGFGAKTILGSSAIGGGLSGLAAGSLPSAAMLGKYAAAQSGGLGLWGGLTKAAGALWEGYQGMNPVFQGALEGALTTPVMNTLTGQETEAEDVMTGAVLGATLAGVRGESFLGSLGKDAAVEGTKKAVVEGAAETAAETATETVAEKGLFDTFLSKAKDTLTDPLNIAMGAVALGPSLFRQESQPLGAPRRVAPFDPADPQFARSAIDVDPVTGEDRFSEESLVSRVVEEGEGKGLGRQLTDAFTDPNEEIEVAQAANGGIISLYPGGSTGSPGGGNNPSHSGHPYYGGPLPGSLEYITSPVRLDRKKDKGGGGAPEEEAKVFTPFTSRGADFDVDDRLARILGTQDTEPTTPIFVPSGSGTATPISATPTNIPAGDAALEDLLSRFRAKREDPIVASVAPVVDGSYQGGLVSLAHGGEPLGQNTPVFEGQVPLNGDGMDDEIPYKVIPQDPEDAPDTPDIALLSSDEYVLPADVVSMLGNGSSNAGAQALDRFTKLVRKKAHGTNKQQTELNEDRELSNLIS